jgi:predicted O-methyltransferase YrrM
MIMNITERINTLDISLFDAIPAQMNDEDKQSLLALQGCVSMSGTYAYLEIGSYQGGSLQSVYADPLCTHIYSIDKRPVRNQDTYAGSVKYSNNSTEGMQRNLRGAFPDVDESKLVCFECDARDVPSERISPQPSLCFIDGEHTVKAIVSDFTCCLNMCRSDAIIAFHDAFWLYEGFDMIKALLQQLGIRFQGFKLGDSIYALVLNNAVTAYAKRLYPFSQDEHAYFEQARRPGLKRRIAKIAWIQSCKHSLLRFPPAQAVPPATGQLPIRIDSKPCIWMTWTGTNPMPDHLKLCLESIRHHNDLDFTIVLITPDNIDEYLPERHPAYSYLSYVHRSDYLRAEILHRWGGLYLDTDTICFRSLQPWYQKIMKYDVVSYDGSPWREVFGMSVFGPTRRDSVLTQAWVTKLRKRLDKRLAALIKFRQTHPDPTQDCLQWTEILRSIVLPVAQKLRRKRQLSFYPISSDYFRAIYNDSGIEALRRSAPLSIPEETYVLILNSFMFPERFKHLTEEEILASDVGVAHLLRQSLGKARLRGRAYEQLEANI